MKHECKLEEGEFLEVWHAGSIAWKASEQECLNLRLEAIVLEEKEIYAFTPATILSAEIEASPKENK